MTKKVPKSTQKYTKILKITKKYQKVPESTRKYINVRGDHNFFTGGTTKVAKNTQNDQKVLKSTAKYSKLLIKSNQQYERLSQVSAGLSVRRIV